MTLVLPQVQVVEVLYHPNTKTQREYQTKIEEGKAIGRASPPAKETGRGLYPPPAILSLLVYQAKF
jgi:hypothetical protein